MKALGAFFLLGESICYSRLFFFLSSHHEFLDLLKHAPVDAYTFLKAFTAYLQSNGLAIAAILILLLLATSIISHLFMRKKTGRDDLISEGCKAAFLIKGIVCMLLLPMTLFVNLNDHLYHLESVLFLVIAQIIAGLIAWTVAQFLPQE